MSATGYIPGDTVYVEFPTQAFATGQATNADSTPVGILNRNGIDAGAVSVTITNLDTGRYKAVFTIPINYVPGDVLNLSVSATVLGVSGKAVVWHAKLVAAGVTLADGPQGGPATVLSLERFIVESLTTNEPAVKFIGNGVGEGLFSSGGISGNGVRFLGGTDSGYALLLETFASDGLYISSAGDGISISSGANGITISCVENAFNLSSGLAGIYISCGQIGIEISSGDVAFSGGNGIDAPLSLTTLASFFLMNTMETYATAVSGSVVKEISDNAVGSVAPTVQEIADQITADHGTGSYVDSGGSAPTVQEIADQITFDHGVGSYVTPALGGLGNITVNHDYGGPDNLAYKTGAGIGIDNAEILVYLKSDYDTGNQTAAHVKGRAATDVNGRWTRSILLDAADYTLVYAKQGAYGPDLREVTVA